MLYLISGLFSGVVSGMGIGGGAILIPILILLAQLPQQTAQGINLLYFLPTAAAALLVHWKNKTVEWRTALAIGLPGMLGAMAGAWAASSMRSELLRSCFGWFLLLTGTYEIYKGIRMKE